MTTAWIWALVALVAVGIEILVVDVVFLFIAAGAAAAFVASLLGADLWLQILIGVAVSALGILLLRPVALRHLRHPSRELRTGVDALPGTHGRALSEVTLEQGLMSLRGDTWTARLDPAITSDPVPAGTPLVVTRIDGATALVHPIDELELRG